MEVLLACVLFYCVMIYFLTLTFITQQSKSAIVGIRNLSRETSKIVLAKYIKSPFNCKKDILIFNSNKYKGDKKRKNKYSYFLVCVFFFFTRNSSQETTKQERRETFPTYLLGCPTRADLQGQRSNMLYIFFKNLSKKVKVKLKSSC